MRQYGILVVEIEKKPGNGIDEGLTAISPKSFNSQEVGQQCISRRQH